MNKILIVAALAVALVSGYFGLQETSPKDLLSAAFAKIVRIFSATPAYGTTPNIVVFLTDDQRFDTATTQFMPILNQKLAKRGVVFENAFVSTPLCCPSRVSLLSGGYYVQNTNILSNDYPNGGARRFVENQGEESSLPPVLQGKGYATGIFGKYLNEYAFLVPHVPAGWTVFNAETERRNNPNWFTFNTVIGTSGATATRGATTTIKQYITDYYRDQLLSFIDVNAAQKKPFFALMSFHAPHGPATPAPQDATAFTGYTYRGRGYGETDVSDKPQWAKSAAADFTTGANDTFYVDQLRSLQAVDRAIGAVIDKIDALGLTNETIIMFTSDNGYLWGEHKLSGKGAPYDESIRVPFMISVPGAKPRIDKSHYIQTNLEIPATIKDALGIYMGADGFSLLGIVNNPSQDPGKRREVFFENFGEPTPKTAGTWAMLRNNSPGTGLHHKYIEYVGGEREYYDLKTDPYELQNLTNSTNTTVQTNINVLKRRLGELKGMAIATKKTAVPNPVLGESYSFQFQPWGGVKPLLWTVKKGAIPPGMTFDGALGKLYGTPASLGTYPITIMLEDSGNASFATEPHRFLRDYTLTVVAPATVTASSRFPKAPAEPTGMQLHNSD